MSSLMASPMPSQSARAIGQTLLNSTDIQRQVLMETIQSAQQGRILESGRTFCPQNADSIRGPMGRFPRAVDLQSCPTGAAGIMHTHVSAPQLRNPTHSLPDIANVVFGDIDASIVLGTSTSDLMFGPADKVGASEAFRDALGLDVESTHDLIGAIESGQIPNPPEARKRVRSRLTGLFQTIPSPHRDIDAQVQQMGTAGAIPARRPVMASCHTHTRAYGSSNGQVRSVGECCDDIRNRMLSQERALSNTARALSDINWTSVVASAAVSSVVSAVVSKRL